MKKMVCILMLAVSILLFAGCGCSHEWQEATCTEPKTCSKCGEIEGEALGHVPGDWEDGEIDFILEKKQENRYCSVCGEMLDTKSVPVTVFFHDGIFDMTVVDFSERLETQLKNIAEILEKNYRVECTIDDVEGAVCTVINEDTNEESARVVFTVASQTVGGSASFLKDINSTFANIGSQINSVDDEIEIIAGIIMTCDPTLSFSEALDVYAAMIDDYYMGQQASGCEEQNGIRYYYTEYTGGSFLVVII